MRELERKRSSVSMLKRASSVLPAFFLHLKREGVADPRAVTTAHVTSFVRCLKDKTTSRGTPLSPWTVEAYAGTVRVFFSFLQRRGLILWNPVWDLRLPRARRLPRAVLSVSEAARLMTSPPSRKSGLRDRAILELLYASGLRRRECLMLDIADLDLAGRTVWVRHGKGRKQRRVPLSNRAAMALDLYLKEARPAFARDPRECALFLSQKARRLSPVSLAQRLRSYGRRARILHPVSPHDLRHACATHLLRGGADIRHVQKLLGHASIQTTALYTSVACRDLREVIARAHPREQGGRGKRR
jgi:integrase/recombinase XerD